jgi:putative acetyltransferase
VTSRIAAIDPQGPLALALLADAAREMRPLYGGDPAAPAPANAALGARDLYVALFTGTAPQGCAALRELDATTAELHRVYVRPSARRHGLGRTLVEYLLAAARRLDYQRVRLETGVRQPAAMALYERLGFRRIAPCGEYARDPTSVCYERELSGGGA